MRKKIIAGNWKMNKTPDEAANYIIGIVSMIRDAKDEVVICAPYVDLPALLKLTKFIDVKIGAQNMHYEEEGAYTGEVSAKMIKELGAEYVIIGHSERRQYYNETDETVNKKIRKALEYDLKPILCVGETLEQKENGITKEWITTQIQNALEGVESSRVQEIVIAYEPIWAIGTGRTASKEDANEASEWIRKKIKDLYGEDIAQDIIILYGGSVKPNNARELFEMKEIDGGLIGGSSLDVNEFSKIINWRG